MSRPARALVDAQALRHNLARVRELAPATRIMAVIKANAYGHGLSFAARALRGADAFGVASIEEALELRAAGVEQPISLLEGFFEASELDAIAEYRLTPVIHNAAQLWDLEHASVRGIETWLKIDTGMHRLGFAPLDVRDAMRRLQSCDAVADIRLMSHLANADNKFDNTTRQQTDVFTAVTKEYECERSLANSAAIAAWPQTHLDWVRPGIMLYGASPLVGVSAAALKLKPVMTLESALIAVHRLRKGDAVGYGGDFVCPEDMRVGVVAIGYGDGYPRQMRPGAPVLIAGRRAALIGRVSMDMIHVDLREHPQAQIGERVLLWGPGLPVEEVATHANTIAYSLFCGVTPRIPRVEATLAQA